MYIINCNCFYFFFKKKRYDIIVKEAKLRQKENVSSRINMWKNVLQPFSFDSRDTKKYKVNQNVNKKIGTIDI